MTAPLMIRGQPPISTAVALLQAQGLPVSDITVEHLKSFFYMGSDGSPIGIFSLELHGADAPLRSLAVAERASGKGLGSGLIRYAEKYAASRSVQSIYLLTTTAEAFFERLGYERIDRSRAPLSIEPTCEFASLCPASSAFVLKSL